jgi:hypothetical protein
VAPDRRGPPEEWQGDGLHSLFRERSVNLNLAMDADRWLEELAMTHPDWSMVVEVKCFLGLSDQGGRDRLALRESARAGPHSRLHANTLAGPDGAE